MKMKEGCLNLAAWELRNIPKKKAIGLIPKSHMHCIDDSLRMSLGAWTSKHRSVIIGGVRRKESLVEFSHQGLTFSLT